MAKPMTQCRHAGCRTLIPFDKAYCPKHEKQVSHDRNVRTYAKRKDRYQDFYRSTAWTRLSKQYRQAHPMCENCLRDGIVRPAAICDHIVELRKDWSRRLDPSNLQSLCNDCHERKHDRFYRK